MKKKTAKEYELQIQAKYSKLKVISEYFGNDKPITLECTNCGKKWTINATSGLKDCFKGCPECGEKSLTYLKSVFIKKAKDKFGDKFDYSKVKYKNNKAKICIICPDHGEFWITPNHFLSSNYGCPKCGKESTKEKLRYSKEYFLQKAKEIHGDKYDYSKVNYVDLNTPVCIICPKHGEFIQKPNKHINRKQGCPKCAQSHGEELVENILNRYNIKHICQYKVKHKLEIYDKDIILDFVLIYNGKTYAIEYNGIQHYQPIEFFGGEEQFKLQQIRDEVVRIICKQNNVNLLEISYKLSEYEVELLIKNFLNLCDN